MRLDIEIPTYCERVGKSGVFAEPVNVISNISFLISAYLIFRYLKRNHSKDVSLYLLAIFTAFIGLGSTIFHIFATPISLLPDSIPIYLTMIIFLWTFLKNTLGNQKIATIITVCFVGLQTFLYLSGFRNVGNVTIRHIVNIVGIPLLILLAHKKYFKSINYLYATLVIYIIAMVLRATEPLICPAFPMGTHFTWHILLAAIPYLGVLFLIDIKKLSKV